MSLVHRQQPPDRFASWRIPRTRCAGVTHVGLEFEWWPARRKFLRRQLAQFGTLLSVNHTPDDDISLAI